MNIYSDFIAIDVEYANSEQDICQVGIAEVKNLEVVNNYAWLIQPPGNIYEEQYIRKHHITPDMTASAGDFDMVWQEIQPVLLNYTQYWAHNAASTELPVLRKHLKSDYDWLDIQDSRDLYQRPDCPANSGNTLQMCCMALGIPFDDKQYHDARYDAEMCARIVIAAACGQQPDWSRVPQNSEQLRKQQQGKRILRLGEFTAYYAEHPSGEEDVQCQIASTYNGAPVQLVDVFDKGDKLPKESDGQIDISRLDRGEGSPLYGKKVVITGAFAVSRKEIERAIEAMGAKKVPNPTKVTDAIIIGSYNVGCNKLVALEKQEAAGRHIARIIGDADLDALLYGDGLKFFL